MDGFFVTIPITYAHAICVTEAGELLLPAIPVTWDLGDFPPLHWELPALRYGIQSGELFGRSVSFTGDPMVGTVVVDATGGSVYTGLGSDPLVHREFLADVIVQPPQALITTSLEYKDIWTRTHQMPIRAGFYDLFNWASCACGSGIGERHQWLNVTFSIKVDADGDETNGRETLLTDFDTLKGYMPLRVQGDLDIMIKTRNLGQPVGEMENFIESRIFRGLGFSITPKGETWFDEESYTAARSELISHTVAGGYEYLTFRQSDTAPFETDTIAITPTLTISYNQQITPTSYPANVTVVSNTLVWDVGALAPGTNASVVVTFFVPGEATENTQQPDTSMLALNWTDADFFNRLAGRWILDERVGGTFYLPIADVPFVVMLPLISQSFTQDFTSIQVGEVIPVRPVEYQGEVFYTATVDIPVHLPAGGHFYFSSSPDTVSEVVVDDGLFVLLNGEVNFSYDFSVENGVPTPVIVEIPRENAAAWAGQTITIEYRDLYSCVVQASEIWLIWVP